MNHHYYSQFPSAMGWRKNPAWSIKCLFPIENLLWVYKYIFQSWTCFPGICMLMFLPQRRYHHNLQSTDGLTILANWWEIVTILVHYQPSYNTSHTMKPSDSLLLAEVTLQCGMYPADKVDISWQLANPQVPPEWPYCRQAQSGCGFTV